METPYYYNEIVQRRKIDITSKFILIGNAINGAIDFDMEIFNDFHDVMLRFPSILKNIKGSGEWDVKLFQVPDHYRITCQKGIYKKPNYGRIIYTYSYMDKPVREVTFRKNEMIILHAHLHSWKNQHTKNEEFLQFELYLTINKTLLIIE